MPTHTEKHRSNEPERCACSGGCATDTASIQDAPRVAVASSLGNSNVFRIPAMDCPNEENDIRKVLAGIEGIRSLRFELASRTLTIDGEQSAQESALQAVRQLGFEVLPIEHEQKTETPSGLGEISKALIALALAIGAEALDFFAPDTLPFKGLGMALAAAAIAFSGFSTYRKGESPWELRRLHYLRKWSHYEQDEAIFPGSQRACCTPGSGGAQGIPLAVGGDRVDSPEDRLRRRHAA